MAQAGVCKTFIIFCVSGCVHFKCASVQQRYIWLANVQGHDEVCKDISIKNLRWSHHFPEWLAMWEFGEMIEGTLQMQTLRQYRDCSSKNVVKILANNFSVTSFRCQMVDVFKIGQFMKYTTRRFWQLLWQFQRECKILKIYFFCALGFLIIR